MLSVQEFAQDWHRLLFAQEMPQVWKQMEEVFRRVVAQVALASHRERGESVDLLIDRFAAAEPDHPGVDGFFTVACRILQEACVVEPSLVGPGQTVRFEAPGFEVVRLFLLDDLKMDRNGDHYLPDGESARALTLIVSVSELGTWRVAGVGRVMAPGSPPTVFWEPGMQV